MSTNKTWWPYDPDAPRPIANSWRRQFPARFDVPAIITTKYEDMSWGNDTAPSFTHRGFEADGYFGYVLWSDAPKAQDREHEDNKRFRITYVSPDEEWNCMLETDDVNEAVAFFDCLYTQ